MCKWQIYQLIDLRLALIHFSQMLHLYTPCKCQKTKNFQTFSGDRRMEHWAKMNYLPSVSFLLVITCSRLKIKQKLMCCIWSKLTRKTLGASRLNSFWCFFLQLFSAWCPLKRSHILKQSCRWNFVWPFSWHQALKG